MLIDPVTFISVSLVFLVAVALAIVYVLEKYVEKGSNKRLR